MTRDASKFQIHWTSEMVVPISVNEASEGSLGIPGNPLPMLGSDDKPIWVILCRFKTYVTYCELDRWNLKAKRWYDPQGSGNGKSSNVGFWPSTDREIMQDN